MDLHCDYCTTVENADDLTPDWNGETGNHLSCEAALRATEYERTYGLPLPTRNKGGWDPTRDRDRAAEAQHGGRYITGVLARALLPEYHAAFPFGVEQTRAILEGKPERYNFPPTATRDLWRSSLSPSGSEHDESGRRTTAMAAQRAARGEDVFGKPLYGPPPTLPESAFDWPIYRAAMAADTLAALHGQASEAEDTILDTLAHCAGIRVISRPLPDGCTGYWPDLPSVIQPHHDGATCPVHETAVP